MAILKIKDADGNFISVPTITGMPKGIYMGVNEPIDLETILWIDTSEIHLINFNLDGVKIAQDGMTFRQWIESEYNDIEARIFTIDGVDRIRWTRSNGNTAYARTSDDSAYVDADDLIIADCTYKIFNEK